MVWKNVRVKKVTSGQVGCQCARLAWEHNSLNAFLGELEHQSKLRRNYDWFLFLYKKVIFPSPSGFTYEFCEYTLLEPWPFALG